MKGIPGNPPGLLHRPARCHQKRTAGRVAFGPPLVAACQTLLNRHRHRYTLRISEILAEFILCVFALDGAGDIDDACLDFCTA